MLPSQSIGLRFLVTDDGSEPFATWFGRLDAMAATKVTMALVRLGQGNLSRAQAVGEGVLEYRIDWGPGYRVYFGRDGATLVILLTGGTKKRQQRDIERARRLWAGLPARGARRGMNGERPMVLTQQLQGPGATPASPPTTRSRTALLREAIDTLLAGDVETGKTVLRDYIKATLGFAQLAAETGTPPKSLIRMFGPRGNPQARNLFGVILCLQRHAGVTLRVTAAP